jgi:hypothetical protein
MRSSRLRVSSQVDVARPPAAVWALLADVRKWPEWSPICTGCTVAPGGTLAAGAILTMRLRLLRFVTVRARARVSTLRPGREIAWEATYLGVHGRHRYSVRPHGRGSTVRNEEVFEGLGLVGRPLLRRWFEATNLSQGSLAGIKRVAEGGSSRDGERA